MCSAAPLTPPRALLASAFLLGGAGALWATTGAPAAKAPAIPQRIVSINLCADQLVLALALPIAGFVLGGLSGAIWGFVSMTICVMLLSAALFFWLGRGGRPAFEGRM